MTSARRRLWAVAAAAAIFAGCLGGGSSGDAPGDPPGGEPPPPAQNRAPSISGNPGTSLVVDEDYDFRPAASDPDGDELSFTVRNRPVWATFESATGRLHGTPGAADVGQFSGIEISVSDGSAADALAPFSIEVNDIALGSVTVSWSPPTTNADGTPLSDLAGYRIYYGRSANDLDSAVAIDNPGTTRRVIDNLSPATWYFSMTSINGTGLESVRTQVGSVTIT
ncbi:MAG: putative Ig domain-containing protein [Planctomycetaceae bacterium]